MRTVVAGRITKRLRTPQEHRLSAGEVDLFKLPEYGFMRVGGLKRRTSIGVLCALLLGCATSPDGGGTSRQIAAILGRQSEAWNAGDIEAFMQPYDRSPDLTFTSGGRITRGWEPTLESYRKRYPTRETMGHLTFSELEVTTLGRDVALVLGRWHLTRAKPVGGIFTLVLRRESGMWKIIHDHTSREAG